MRKVLFFSLALAVLLLAVTLLGCGGGKSPTASNLNGSTYGSIDEALAELEALTPPEGVDPSLFEQLKDAFRKALESRGGKITSTPPPEAVDDLAAPDPQPDPDNPVITWTGGFFPGDGNGDGIVKIDDITPIALYFGRQWTDDAGEYYELLSRSADYDVSGDVAIADITPVARNFMRDVSYFVVEWSADLEPDVWSVMDDPLMWDAHEPELNEYGLPVFVFPLNTIVLDALELLGAETALLRVTPYDADDNPGTTSGTLEFDLGGITPPPPITVTDILVDITGAVNTEGDAYDGTEHFDAPDSVTDVTGETPANTMLTVVLSDIAYTYEGTSYAFGDAPPVEITTEEWTDIWDALYGSMTYTVVSDEVPVDAEAWTETDPQPLLGLEGYAGPNDDPSVANADGLRVTATMNDNDYTPGATTITVNVVLDLTDDVNAPEIYEFQPPDQPQNKNRLVSIRVEWGADEVGDELPAVPGDPDNSVNGVALYDATTMALKMTFDPATVVETPAPPTEPGEYTLDRFPGVNFTTVIQVLVPAGITQGDYIWRVAEMDGTFERRSSLKKPGDLYTVIGPEYFDMYTWPQGGEDGTFSCTSGAQTYMYFFPEDPKVRRNPVGGPTPPPADPPEFEPKDPVAYADFIKGDDTTGQEFLIVYGSKEADPPEPDSPMVYYLYLADPGDPPAMTIGEADGSLPVPYLQPHMIAAIVFGTLTEEGDIAFSLFDKSGTLLGFVKHYATTMPQPRSAPIIDGECNFGVRPWGAGLGAEDWSVKNADKSDFDAIVFTAKNVWLRHDDGATMQQLWRSTHLEMQLMGSGVLPEQLLLTPIVGPDPDGLVYMMIDVTNPDWWQNIVRDIDLGEYDLLTLTTPGAGSASYTDHLWVVP